MNIEYVIAGTVFPLAFIITVLVRWIAMLNKKVNYLRSQMVKQEEVNSKIIDMLKRNVEDIETFLMR